MLAQTPAAVAELDQAMLAPAWAGHAGPDQARQQGVLAIPWGHPHEDPHLQAAPGCETSDQACQTANQPVAQSSLCLLSVFTFLLFSPTC